MVVDAVKLPRAVVVPYSICETDGLLVVHEAMAPVEPTRVVSTPEIVGGV